MSYSNIDFQKKEKKRVITRIKRHPIYILIMVLYARYKNWRMCKNQPLIPQIQIQHEGRIFFLCFGLGKDGSHTASNRAVFIKFLTIRKFSGEDFEGGRLLHLV